MSNTSQNSSIPLIQVAKHTRARIVLWQSVHRCSALPEPLQEPPTRANPVMRYPSAAGFFFCTTGRFKGVDPGRLPPADNALGGIRFRTFQAYPKDVGGPLQAYSVSSKAISHRLRPNGEIMMHPHLPSPLPVAVPDIGFAQSISIGPNAPDSSAFADLPRDHCSGATRPLDRIVWLPSPRPWFAVQS